MHKVYLAGPLFSEAELAFNRRVRETLAGYFDVYLPQEDGGLMVEMIAKGASLSEASQSVFDDDMNALRNCDIFIIILDGRSIDEGAAFELGCAHVLGKPCFGLKTDTRQLMKYGDNPMVRMAIAEIFPNMSQLVDWARSFASARTGSLLPV
jgi:nucleoside 2-deoxyribosyltransferase